MKVFLETLGCPKNQYDSDVLRSLLEEEGHKLTEIIEEADALIVNTCGFIEDAKKESIDRLFDLSSVKKKDSLLIATGCLSGRYGEELYKAMPEVDLFFGVNDYDKLPRALSEFQGKRGVYNRPWPTAYEEQGPRFVTENPYSLPIKIAEGCNNLCAFCVIPAIRGRYRSRKKEDILAEARMLAKKGCKELVLVAQDVTGYGKDLYGRLALPELLTSLCRIEGLHWIRLMYCYEDKITDELIEVMKTEDKICKYIDIPIQHSSDGILRSMRRASTRASLLNTIGRLREAIPSIHIRTTLISGFPGEGKAEFEDLLAFVDEVKFERLGIFSYSKEEGTPAAEMKPQVRRDVKDRRRDTILRHQIEISLEHNQRKIGSLQEVLVEGIDDEGSYFGRTAYDAPEIDNSVIFNSEKQLNPGDFVFVKITDAFDYDLVGELIS